VTRGRVVRRGVALVLLAGLGAAVCAAPVEQVVAGVDAVVFACTPVDAKSAKTGTELLEKARAQRGLDLGTIRNGAAYRTAYNAEVNRLLALAPKERTTACQNVW
jgi:hypothetical protein